MARGEDGLWQITVTGMLNAVRELYDSSVTYESVEAELTRLHENNYEPLAGNDFSACVAEQLVNTGMKQYESWTGLLWRDRPEWMTQPRTGPNTGIELE